jgi:hypothetical protein
MCNINNSPNRKKQDLKGFCTEKNFIPVVINKFNMLPQFLTAKEQVATGLVTSRANSYPLQDPIKNIICHPE